MSDTRPAPECGELRAILDRIRAGDEQAASDLLVRYEAQVRLVVRRQLPKLLRSRFDSLDFLQSVWGSFFRRIHAGPVEFEDPKYLVAFLARAARNKVIDEYRRAASQKNDIRREEPIWVEGLGVRDLPVRLETPSELAEARETFDRLSGLLPEDRRSLLALKADGLTNREVGERLGVSERTVRRVIEGLRRRVRDESADGAGGEPDE